MQRLFHQKSPFRRKVVATTVGTLTALTLFFSNLGLPLANTEVHAETLATQPFRLAGITRYDTALQVSQEGWEKTNAVVLARGDDYPDALAGAVLANSSKVGGPLLLTDTSVLTDGVLSEINRLQATTVYILGGTGAVSDSVESTLKTKNFTVKRLSGVDRYETAAKIALETTAHSDKVFIASGDNFADALSISSYAAAQGSPLLLTEADTLPEATLKTLKTLGATSVTLIGGEGVIKPTIQTALEKESFKVDRLAGIDRYETNIKVLNSLPQSTDSLYVATGEDFPAALAGAVLAAKTNNPIVLVPKKDLSTNTLSYLGAKRTNTTSFTMLGGWGVISYGLESMIRTGSSHPRVSFQYIQSSGSSAYTNYMSQLSMIPDKATDYVDFVSPHWFSLSYIPSGQTVADGSFKGPWDAGSVNYKQAIAAAHARGLKVIPDIFSGWSEDDKAAIDSVLQTESARKSLIANIEQMLKDTGADGVALDFEYMSDASGPYLTQLMKELYPILHNELKIVAIAVPARTASVTWYDEFNYHDLSQYTDYLNIMAYDYSKATPGPIAPLGWVKDILDFTVKQKVEMNKVLLLIPYYGRDWAQTAPGTYTQTALGLNGANTRLKDFSATVQRETTPQDSVGIPMFTYTDTQNLVHKVYYEDALSWQAKLALLDDYNLAGMGGWSLNWLVEESAQVLYPILSNHLR